MSGTFNSVRIDRGNVGVVNTESIHSVQVSLAGIQQRGNEPLAAALKELTEAVINSTELHPAQKNDAVQMLDTVAADAARPNSRRRRSLRTRPTSSSMPIRTRSRSMPIIARDPVHDELWFSARMTNIQFQALAVRLERNAVISETGALLKRRTISAGNTCDKADVSMWLRNGWSTEKLLELNQANLEGDSLRHSLHWAFPQVYYSVFSVALAYFKAVGFTESAHTAVIRKFAQEVVVGAYPAPLSFALSGKNAPTFSGLCCSQLATTLTFDQSDSATIDGQLAQFLRATRDIDLKTRKANVKFTTKQGVRKKALRTDEWEKVSDGLGPTALLSLLYRKRIKANYQDIDTFLHAELQPEPLYRHLLGIVGATNFVHEVFIARALGEAFLRETLESIPSAKSRVERRLPVVCDVAKTK